MSELIVLRGKIAGYRSERKSADFFFSPAGREALGLTAVAAATVGASGVAMGAAISSTSTREEADYVEFVLEGRRVKGWLWRSPFAEGEVVEAAVKRSSEREADELVAVARPGDRMIALYPHLSRGRRAHRFNALKWWAMGSSLVVAGMAFVAAVTVSETIHWWEMFGESKFLVGIVPLSIFFYLFFLAYTFWAMRRWMPYVKAAEDAFKAFGWEEVEKVDLVRASKISRKGDEPFGYGLFFFRY